MLIPIGHENMEARRWPVITLALIAINTAVFLYTISTLDTESPQLGEIKSHILNLAALHPELKMKPEAQQLVDAFKQSHPAEWSQVQNPYRDIISAYDARIKLMDDPVKLQAEMDSQTEQYLKLSSSAVSEQYAFVPSHPNPISYLTANFMHGGWLHLIGNMWFLWLAGFVLEDAWGRIVYSIFYLAAGAAALQFYAWTNPGSITPTLGASGAVAALMGAFLVRFPKMKIDMAWLLGFRLYRFQAAAFWLLPFWLLMEIFYGTLFGNYGGVAHWAHVGGFVFGAVIAVGIKYSGLEHVANKAIEEKLEWKPDTQIEDATSMMEHGQLADAQMLLGEYLASNPNSLDAWNMLRQVYTRQSDTKGYLEATLKLCASHLKAREVEAAFQDYAEFVDSGGGKLPPDLWLELCKGAESLEEFDRALAEYLQLAESYPTERQALTAQLSAARLCLKKLNRPHDALILYQTAAASPIPHLDWEAIIQTGIKEAKAAIAGAKAAAAGAQ